MEVNMDIEGRYQTADLSSTTLAPIHKPNSKRVRALLATAVGCVVVFLVMQLVYVGPHSPKLAAGANKLAEFAAALHELEAESIISTDELGKGRVVQSCVITVQSVLTTIVNLQVSPSSPGSCPSVCFNYLQQQTKLFSIPASGGIISLPGFYPNTSYHNAVSACVACGTTCYPVSFATPPFPTDQQPNVILGRPTDSSVSFAVYSYYPGVFSISYGAPNNFVESATNRFEAGVVLMTDLTGLSPSTNYSYQLNYKYDLALNGPWLVSRVNSFMTARSPEESFRFGIYACSHWLDAGFELKTFQRSLQNMVNSKLDFVLDLGDTFMTGKETFQTLAEPYNGVFNYLAQFLPSVPVYLVNGNHDAESDCGAFSAGCNMTSLPVLRVQTRKAFFPNPTPSYAPFYTGNTDRRFFNTYQGDYYAWNWGSALFATLDPFWYTHFPGAKDKTLLSGWTWTLGFQQYQWLNSTLTASESKFKFIFLHNYLGGAFNLSSTQGNIGIGDTRWTSFFEWGGNNPDGTYGFPTYRSEWTGAVPLQSLFEQTGVTCVFKGHDHVFNKGVRNSVTYITLPHISVAQSNSPKSADVLIGYTSAERTNAVGYIAGYSIVTVSPTEAIFTFKKFNETAAAPGISVTFTPQISVA